jgi:TRAP-type C4-dicarboxylate transport system permease small subunit
MGTIADVFGKVLSLAARLAAALGALSLLALALLETLDVLSTGILKYPIPGVIKLSESGLVLILFLGVAVATRNRGHIRVDILLIKLRPRARRFCDAIGSFFASLFFSLWTWQMWLMTVTSWTIRERATGLLPYPIYPLKFLLFVGLLIATIESIRRLSLSAHEIYDPNSRRRKG